MPTASRILLILAMLIAGSPAALPQTPPAVRRDPVDERAGVLARSQQRRAFLDALPQGAPFRSRGQQYRIVGGVRAVARESGEADADALARAGAAAGDAVESKGHYLVFRQGAAAPLPAQARSRQADTLPVAVNARTGNLGVVLGTIAARLRKPSDAAAIAADHGLELVAAAPPISMAFYRPPPGQDVQAAAAALARDARVASAELEVKEHLAEPQ